MNYHIYPPHPDLKTVVKCFWTLEMPVMENVQRQMVLPDGCVDICFILGDDIKRYLHDNDFIIQPRQMLLGQITEPFYVEPMGHVNTFAIRFYPYGFAHFIDCPLHELKNKETPLNLLFGDHTAELLKQHIIQAGSVHERIEVMEAFLFKMLHKKSTIDSIVKDTIDAMYLSRGSKNLFAILKDDIKKRRQLERKFLKQIGVSPKQLSRAIRLQAALQILLDKSADTLTQIAYEHAYYDQAHFIKDFKEFTGVTPKEFLTDETMVLSSLLYKKH